MRKYCLFLWVMMGVSLLPLNASSQPAVNIKRQMQSHLDFIHQVIQTKYAPNEWKQAHLGWSLDKEYARACDRVSKLQTPSLKSYQIILKDFFNSMQDYHVSVRFFSTEEANLPFLIKGAEGRYFISYVNKADLPSSCQDLKIGDEVLAFNGVPIATAIQKIRTAELGNNTEETDFALAELLLTNRKGESGHEVPFGSANVTVRKNGNQTTKVYPFTWNYTPEKIQDVSKLPMAPVTRAPVTVCKKAPNLKESFFERLMVCPYWSKEAIRTCDNPYQLGSRKSFLPSLGFKVWESESDSIFHAYIFKSSSGKRIGYVRIPHYLGDEVDADEFAEVINRFQKQTDALVIDQLNNPGGSLFYLYGLASMLTDSPLETPKHHLTLTQEEVGTAVTWLPIIESIHDDQTAHEILGDTMDGYPLDMRFVRLLCEFFYGVIQDWNAGNLYTKPSFLFGVDKIQPHPAARYTKPIVVLTNSLCFSGGDFFPAILQDNKRATILGTRTAGAGGYVITTHFPNHLGIHNFNITGSLAERIDEKPLENLGVIPDIECPCTVRDLQSNYPDFVATILQTVNEVLSPNN